MPNAICIKSIEWGKYKFTSRSGYVIVNGMLDKTILLKIYRYKKIPEKERPDIHYPIEIIIDNGMSMLMTRKGFKKIFRRIE